jgi:D-sedoheptulose 7-phosphate isomerase
MNLQNYKRCFEDIELSKLEQLKLIISEYRKIIILGNGGSNAISSHIAEDYTKELKKQAICFGDTARLSCYANDYGWENAYSQFIKEFADADTLVILISSSGNSQNILNTAAVCKDTYKMITLSGFSNDNKLKTNYTESSLLHFWVDSNDFGIVECIHELILHSVI